MVDTLAPKKIFTQRELDKSLTPSPVAAAIMQPAKNIMDMSPDQKMPGGVIQQQSDFLVDPNSIMASMQENQAPGTMEREQTIRSSEETTADKQTGERADRQTTQGLASRPGVENIKDRFDAPTEEEIQKKLQQTKEAEILRDNIILQMEEQYGLEDMKRQAEMGLINDGGRYTDPDFIAPSQKYNMKLMDSD
jgi:hypothetical protein